MAANGQRHVSVGHAQACAEQLKKVCVSDRIKTLRAELARRQDGA
jgi:hypothetical protein